jgi:hypothetical protein
MFACALVHAWLLSPPHFGNLILGILTRTKEMREDRRKRWSKHLGSSPSPRSEFVEGMKKRERI